eukprot:m.214946 g.214946  ORF g.214946 m.214946 type:complete len:106 (-) comp15540_c0_seq1:2206-2523(-)
MLGLSTLLQLFQPALGPVIAGSTAGASTTPRPRRLVRAMPNFSQRSTLNNAVNRLGSRIEPQASNAAAVTRAPKSMVAVTEAMVQRTKKFGVGLDHNPDKPLSSP